MRYLITIITFFLALSVNAQQIEKQVISSTGNEVSAGGLQISQTVGEVAVETYTSGSFILGQGFQQVEEIDEDTTNAIKVIDVIVNYKVFPNPTNGQITISLELSIGEANLKAKILNTLGQTIFIENITIESQVLNFKMDLKNFDDGYYFLNFYNDNNELLKTIDIIKI